GGDIGDVAHLGREVVRVEVAVVGQVTPGPGGARHMGQTAQPAFSANLARDAGDLRGKSVQLVDHDVDRVLQLKDLSPDFDGDLFGEVALLHGGRDLGDVAHLGREIGGEVVHVVGEVLPDPGRAGHPGLATEEA